MKKQVEEQVEEQLVRDHLGTPLNVQVEAGREQITALRAAVQNSYVSLCDTSFRTAL